MLSALLGGYLTAYPPVSLPPATAAAPSPSARLPAPFPARLRRASLLVARRRAAGAGEALSASAAAEGDDEYEATLLEQEEGFPSWTGGGEEDDYDHDPEIGDIMGDYFDDPKKAQTRMEDRIRKKRHKIVQTKTGSPNPMKVVFNKFDFSNSYIWFEFYNALLPKDVTLISDSLRSWHIVGRLGGCNSMNMQLSQLPLDCKRPTYDALEGANITPTSFYNIGDLEIQDNLARVWVDIGIHEPLLLDILLNALTTISSDQMHKLHVDNHLDRMDTIWTKGVHVYGHLEVVATATSGGALAAASGGMRRRYAVRSRQFAARGENSMPAARRGNCMPKIPDAADEIEVLRAAKRNLEGLRRGAGLNQRQIAHLPHPPTH